MGPHLQHDSPSQFLDEELSDGVDEDTPRSVNQDQWAYAVGDVEMPDRDFDILRCLSRAEIRRLDT